MTYSEHELEFTFAKNALMAQRREPCQASQDRYKSLSHGWAAASHGSQPDGGTLGLQLWLTADLAQQSHCTAVRSGFGTH